MNTKIENKNNRPVKKTRQHGRKTWFSNECEVLHKECMAMKYFLTHEHSLDSYELSHIHVKKYEQIRCLKT